MPLSLEVVENARPDERAVRLFDERGLYLEVSPGGGKWWRLKYRFAGKEKRLSLGVYPDVSLVEARERRDSYRALLADGIDPSEHLKAERARLRAEEARQGATTSFTLDNDGALAFRLGSRRIALTPAETAELRAFLDATRAVIPKE